MRKIILIKFDHRDQINRLMFIEQILHLIKAKGQEIIGSVKITLLEPKPVFLFGPWVRVLFGF